MAVLTQSDLVYQGAFRLPKGGVSGNTFAYGGETMALNPAGDGSLYISGHTNFRKIAEVSIPAPVNSGTLGDLNTATLLQSFVEPTEGGAAAFNSGNGVKIGGLLVNDGELIVSAYDFYDATNQQIYSHFRRPLDLSVTEQVTGPYRFQNAADTTQKAGFFSGYMCDVPAAHQAAVGAPNITANCCLNIIGRTSWGPAAFGFDPADLGETDPVPAVPLVYYSTAHQTLGYWAAQSELFNGTSVIHGVAFPDGFDSLLFFGRQGIGPWCYGTASECSDPTGGGKGNHAYPYRHQIWHYDINDLLAASNPWDVVPDVWPINVLFESDKGFLGGVTFDPVLNRIYVLSLYGDQSGLDPYPLVHVFDVAGTPASPPATVERDKSTIDAGQSMLVSWSDIGTPSATDLVGLFVTGDNRRQEWWYLNGSKTPPDDPEGAAGDVSFTIPGRLRSGTYEFRLMTESESVDENGEPITVNSLLATSETFTVRGKRVKVRR